MQFIHEEEGMAAEASSCYRHQIGAAVAERVA
jgi:hypothetical protein